MKTQSKTAVFEEKNAQKHYGWNVTKTRFFTLASGTSTDRANGLSGMTNRRWQSVATHCYWATQNKSDQYLLQLFGYHKKTNKQTRKKKKHESELNSITGSGSKLPL